MKRFTQLTNEEILTIANEDLNDAVRVEALEQGIQVPLTIPEAIRSSEWRGYQKPAEAVQVFELATTSYSSHDGSGIAYLTKEAAERALEGALCLGSDYRAGVSTPVIKPNSPVVLQKWIGVCPAESKAAKFQEYRDAGQERFSTLVDECIKRFEEVRQADYDRKIRETKWAEYLRLAGGSVEIAANFWSRTEGTVPHP